MKPLILSLLFSLSLLAQNDTSWVSASGSDANSCVRSAPCRTFQRAHDQTNAGGAAKAADAADFGPLAVSKSITIDGSGLALLSGISITVGPATIKGLTVQAPTAGATNGILASADTRIEDVLIAGAYSNGINLDGSAASVRAVLLNVATTVTGHGVSVNGAQASIKDSSFGYGSTGVYVQSAVGRAAQVVVQTSDMSYNTTGLLVDNTNAAGAIARISADVLTGNVTGAAYTNGGQIITLRNNFWLGNTTDGTTPFSQSLK